VACGVLKASPHDARDDRGRVVSLSRRGFISGLLAAGAAGMASRLWTTRAHAAPMTAVYPTIFIQLRGGWDPVQHFCARTGHTNRSIVGSQLKTTASGVVYFAPLLAGMTAHVEDAVVIRNLHMGQTDHRVGPNTLWYGDLANQTTRAPWTNYLASKLLERAPAVAPNLTAYWTYDSNGGVNDFVNFNNRSPSPLGAAQRLLTIDGFARSLDVSMGMPTAARQKRINDFIAKRDADLYSPKVQGSLLESYGQASAQANDLVGKTISKVWPPDAATMTAFGASAADLTARGYGGIPGFKAMCMLAFQLARTQASHVISFDGDTALGGITYDTHSSNITGQMNAGRHYFDPIGRLLSALKATPSPIDPARTMFDTTHVVIASEMGRSPNAENGSGTFHWPWTQAVLFGGNFKRGFAFGELNGGLTGVPADFNTGKLNTGSNASWINVVNTVLKANGVDPAGFDKAAPINAVLQA
jgi:uncharacterized protein (DUF1501 family)